MKTRFVVIAGSVVVAIAVAGFVRLVVPRFESARLTFRLQDAVSGSWVWDATATLQNREIRSYYQSNVGPLPLTFTNLKPGRSTLTIMAPDYVTVKIPLRLHLGENVIAKPVELKGYQIPGLSRFAMFETRNRNGLSVQLRPVNSAGHAITTMPCLDLWVGAMVSAEMDGGRPAQEPVSRGASRGPVLYRGKIDWTWDPSITQDFRYNAVLSFAGLSSHAAPFLVIDYLVIVPDPRKITAAQIDSMMGAAPDLDSPVALRRYLEAQRGEGRFTYFFSTSWNVAGPRMPAKAGT